MSEFKTKGGNMIWKIGQKKNLKNQDPSRDKVAVIDKDLYSCNGFNCASGQKR